MQPALTLTHQVCFERRVVGGQALRLAECTYDRRGSVCKRRVQPRKLQRAQLMWRVPQRRLQSRLQRSQQF